MDDINKKAIDIHRKKRGKLTVASTMPVTSKDELTLAYTPGVGAVSAAISDDAHEARELTGKGNAVAVVSDGSAVLGLGDIGPEAALPVMEGKAVLFKEFASIDAYPLVLSTQNVDEIVMTVKAVSPGFSGINLEDIAAPRCFEIEKRLQEELDIPVFHDDQHGTAIVVLAGLINALAVVGKQKEHVRVVVSGAGAAGIAVTKLLDAWGIQSVSTIDSGGVISADRSDVTDVKRELLSLDSYAPRGNSLSDETEGADVFIGVSKPGILSEDDVVRMTEDSIIFALSNPDPEIMPEKAKRAGASVVATGRSDFPNQVNNVLAFPGIFRGLLDSGVENVTDEIKQRAAEAIAGMIQDPSEDNILPDPFDPGVVEAVAGAVKESAA